MGCDAHAVVVDTDASSCGDALRYASERIEHLESRWSRFRVTSEISRINLHRGVPVVVSSDTYRLVETAARACADTQGLYDPTVIDAMCDIGYDRDFADLRTTSRFVAAIGTPAPGCAGMRLDPTLSAVSLGNNVGFDPGGIGKGLAADIVVGELRAAGVAGAMVNLGGDVAVDGAAPDEHGWIVGIEDPHDATRIVGRVTLESGGACTSSRVTRSWQTTNNTAVHHLLDPRTGGPIATPLLTATVVAGTAWWAEALTKALFVASSQHDDATHPQIERLLVNAHACCIDENDQYTTYGDAGVFDFASDNATR